MKTTRLVSHLAVAAVLLVPAGALLAQPMQRPAEAVEKLDAAVDTALEARVQIALKNDQRLAASNITVSSKGDTVSLAGTVDNRADKSRAVELASRVDGVKKVEDKITVAKSTP